ncbi:bZIP transcription factor [Aspergillus mulundensis]|uniref:BZIP domain-containing protein n=1 Tax=Aspergillus mulundensis TaxID=1810919 RepID=A0A3D8T515_9EURO|nr:Uncharacterized protein DSM5745_00936 [Aspergillus mulundensis]RDW93614.1 Uncharacterized protein DSM5745_00936 [Aspergillus mulundensis]
MDSAVEKKRLDKLARVRENQRKSRARKQDHLQDLERKVLSLQRELDRRDVENRLAVQRLEAENRKLRDLHLFLGVPPDALEEYLRIVDDPVMAQKVAIPALQRPQGSQMQPEKVKWTQPEPNPRTDTPLGHESVVGTCQPSTSEPRCRQPRATPLPPFCACSADEGPESLPISERVLNTTFCAIAEKLVNQYNARGVDVSEIQAKLRKGFFRSSSEEGCRVQNQNAHHAHFCRLATHLTTYTNPSNTGTSISGPTVAAKAWSLSTPNAAIATAIASSKLLLAAVKLCVQDSLYPNPNRLVTASVTRKITAK